MLAKRTGIYRLRLAGYYARDRLPAVATINSEIGVGGKDHGITLCFGHSHKTSVSETHRNIRILVNQPQYRLQVLRQIKIKRDGIASEYLAERSSAWPCKQMESFGQHRFAGTPGGWVRGGLRDRPCVVGILLAQ